MEQKNSTQIIEQQNKRLEDLKDIGYDKSSFSAGFFEGYGYAHLSNIDGDFKARLVVEYKELKEKTNKLILFIKDIKNSNDFEQNDWNILTVQRDIMVSYISILEMRLIKLKMQDVLE